MDLFGPVRAISLFLLIEATKSFSLQSFFSSFFSTNSVKTQEICDCPAECVAREVLRKTHSDARTECKKPATAEADFSKLCLELDGQLPSLAEKVTAARKACKAQWKKEDEKAVQDLKNKL